ALGLILGRAQIGLGLLPVGDVTQDGTVAIALLDGADGQEKRNFSAMTLDAGNFAAVIEDRRQAAIGHGIQIVLHRLGAFAVKEGADGTANRLTGLIAKDRLGAGVEAADGAVAFEDDDAVGGRLKDRA